MTLACASPVAPPPPPAASGLGKGSYGKVSTSPSDDGAAVKTTDVFDAASGALVRENLVEAALAARLAERPLPGTIAFRGASVAPAAPGGAPGYRLAMERAPCGDLHDFVRRTPFVQRMRVVEEVLDGLLLALHALHRQGVTHGDLKPHNVVLLDDRPGSVRLALVDFGSALLYGASCRGAGAQQHQCCTYPFAPPEYFEPAAGAGDDADRVLKHDAYSLGALVHYFIFRAYLYDFRKASDFEAVRLLHLAGPVFRADAEPCPRGVPPGVYAAVAGLLEPDPARRTGVRELYLARAGARGAEEPDVERAPRTLNASHIRAWAGRRREAVRFLAGACGCASVLALACNLADRAACALGRPCTLPEMLAARHLATALLCPTEAAETPAAQVRDAIVLLLRLLDCRLYTDTCATLLVGRTGSRSLDRELLCRAIVQGRGKALASVRAYLRLQGGEEGPHESTA